MYVSVYVCTILQYVCVFQSSNTDRQSLYVIVVVVVVVVIVVVTN